MQTQIHLTSDLDLADYTVIIPSVCVGNVAQLGVDLIISTLQLQKAATIWHPAIIPIIGPRAFDHTTGDAAADDITTACELFVSDATKKLACFQFRSPLVPDQMFGFFDQLLDFLQKHRIGHLIILTSSFAHEQHTIESNKFVYLANDSFKTTFAKQLAAVDWNEHRATVIHGGGFAMKLWQRVHAANVSACLLFKYVSEGDNRADAVQFVEQLDLLRGTELLGNNTRMKMPVSWKALFGNEPTEQLY